ncbi:DUF1826 domain-containing protein [Salinispirillum sp. LH 10-3-1]|uniref:DUF1826 domain-containing protein n=1 Tax=Salinispirillum sp. LH 10-3-1 TaxID=2952525 RepID=A0AB38YHN2_9GAMM
MLADTSQLASTRHHTATDQRAWTEIFSPSVNLAVWQRQLSEPLKAGVKALLTERPSIRIQESGTVTELHQRLHQCLGTDSTWTPLLDDIALSLDMFQVLFDQDTIGLRLTGLDKAMCPRFHVDRVLVRGICTYAGPATEWLANEHIPAREQQSGPLLIPTDADQHIQHLPLGAFALMKGEAWPGNEGRGLVHRSPPCTSDDPRLLLTLDLC